MVDVPAVVRKLPPDLLPAPPARTVSETTRDEIRVVWRFQEYSREKETARFWGGVKATYGPTTLECEELLLDYANRTGRAIGKVRLVDPDGVIEAENLVFNWRDKTGQAERVRTEVAGMRLSIEKLEIAPKRWFAAGVRGTPSTTRPPDLEFRARELTLEPGRRGRAVRPGLSVFGLDLGTIPTYAFSLDPRIEGFRPPTISFQQGDGLGLSWLSSFFVDDQSAITGKWAMIPASLPNYQLEWASSPVAPESMRGRITTRSDVGDRLNTSWFDSIIVPRSTKEWDGLRQTRRNFTIGTYWNQTTRGRREDSEEVSKMLDLAYEVGGAQGDWGLLGQLRLQRLRGAHDEPFVDRLFFQGIAHSGERTITSGLGIVFRLDSNATLDKDGGFAWLRGAGYFVGRPNGYLTLAAGSVYTVDAGNARFAFDELFRRNALHFRADARVGPVTLAGLVKYDLLSRDWYSVEYTAALVAGSFEPYIYYRQVPRDVQFGVRLRTNAFFDLLSDRNVRRQQDRTKQKGAEANPRP